MLAIYHTGLQVRLDPGTQAASLLLPCQILSQAGSPWGLACWSPTEQLWTLTFAAQVHADGRLSQASKSWTCLTLALIESSAYLRADSVRGMRGSDGLF